MIIKLIKIHRHCPVCFLLFGGENAYLFSHVERHVPKNGRDICENRNMIFQRRCDRVHRTIISGGINFGCEWDEIRQVAGNSWDFKGPEN